VTSGMKTDTPCQFSNWMSSSQFQCHRDVINDTKVRIGANTSRTALAKAKEMQRVGPQFWHLGAAQKKAYR
jgi:hypothetical protein